MIGFALIVILVAVIVLIFLGFSLNRPSQTVESYKAQSFLRASLQYTTSCQGNFGYLSVQDLIHSCDAGSRCNDGSDPCGILNETLGKIIKAGWNVGGGSPVKGYSINISSNSKNVFSEVQGNLSANSEGTSQEIPRGGIKYTVALKIYY